MSLSNLYYTKTMDTRQRIFPALPRWVAWTYAILAAITVPWTIYLANTLPEHPLAQHWDKAWVGMDIAIVTLLVLNAIYAYKESKWLIMSATATSMILVVDAWFDVMSAHTSSEMRQALILAFLIELPLAILTFVTALKLVKRERHV